MTIDKKKDCNWDDWPWKGDKRGKVYFSVRNIDSQKVNNISFLLIIWIIFQPSKLKIIPSNSHATINRLGVSIFYGNTFIFLKINSIDKLWINIILILKWLKNKYKV